MDDLDSFWTFQENVEELQQKLHYVTRELEITRKQTNEELMRSSEHIKKLLLMLQTTCKERDEVRYQLKKLQQILVFNNKTLNFDQFMSTTSSFPATPFSPDSPLLSNFSARANSESNTNSFSIETTTTTNNNFPLPKSQSHVSSPVVDSLSHNNTPDSNNNCYINTTSTSSNTLTKTIDRATMMIEKLAKGRPRPKQGKLLQAVIEAGPILQTLIVAGSLPQWRNPPGVVTRQIPPVQICQSSMLDFGGSSSALSFDCPTTKRQRLL